MACRVIGGMSVVTFSILDSLSLPLMGYRGHGWRRRNHGFGGHNRNMMSFVVEEPLHDPASLGHHVILPSLLCLLLATRKEGLGGVEAVHAPLPHGVEAMNLLQLAVSEPAVVDLDPRNGSLK